MTRVPVQTPPRPRQLTGTPAWAQHQQDALEALDSLIGAAMSYRGLVAADQPSIAIARQLAADVTRIVSETGHMTGLANAERVLADEIAAGEQAA